MSLFRYPQTYYKNDGAYVGGEWTASVTGPFTFLGTIQPDTGKDVFPKETGRDDTGRVRVFSSTRLAVGEEDGGAKGDMVIYDGRWYELIQAFPHQNRIIPHYEYLAELREGFTP